jgi:hypothetical protein
VSHRLLAGVACAWLTGVAGAQVTASPTPAAATPAVLTVRAEPARDPWWLRASLVPRATVVRGLPIKRFEPAWCAAEAFSRDLFGEELLGLAGGNPLDGVSFALDGNFDGGTKLQTAFVGAYRRCDGEHGLFLAIIERSGERTRMRFLVEVPDPGTAFAALSLEPDGALAVWWCAACDNGHRIVFNRETRGYYVAGPATRRPLAR